MSIVFDEVTATVLPPESPPSGPAQPTPEASVWPEQLEDELRRMARRAARTEAS